MPKGGRAGRSYKQVKHRLLKNKVQIGFDPLTGEGHVHGPTKIRNVYTGAKYDNWGREIVPKPMTAKKRSKIYGTGKPKKRTSRGSR